MTAAPESEGSAASGDVSGNPIEYGPEKRLPRFGRDAESLLWIATTAVAVGLALYMLYYSATRYVSRGHHTVLAMGWGLVLYVLVSLLTTERRGLARTVDAVVALGMIGAVIATSYYFFTAYDDLRGRVLDYLPIEYLLGGILLLIVVELTRRAYGNVLTAVVVASIGYGYFGVSLPWWFNHRGVDFSRIVEINVLTLDGIYGTIPQVGVTWVAIFLIYAGLLEAFGALNLVFAAGRAVERRLRAGTAQTAVVSSLFMGSISGSAVANTATTGSFTIPLMKGRGINPETAAGIESAASSGGQVMPPVMGAAAFVMAGILNISYLEVLVVALLPALLFYFAVSASTQVLSLKQDAVGVQSRPADGPAGGFDAFRRPPREILIEGLPVILSVVVLLYYLAWVRLDPMSSALRAIVAVIAGQLLWTLFLRGVSTAAVVDTAKRTVQGFQIGAVVCAPIFAVLGSIGLLVNMITVGDFTRLLTFAMLDYSGGNLLLLLFLAMIMSLIFGLGMPTVAAYVLVAIFVGPAVVEFGVDQIYAHMFVFYFAILSAVTPPVALGCVVACKIAETSFFKTCKEALKITLPVFVLPYAFVIHENLIRWDATTAVTFLLVAIGIFGLIVGINGYVFDTVGLAPQAAAGVAGATLMLTNDLVFDLLAAAVVVAVVAANYLWGPISIRRRQSKPA
ncbi:TRAP transporter permease [Haloferacaceae archaeon DSL9]